jgi:hypothetical protein
MQDNIKRFMVSKTIARKRRYYHGFGRQVRCQRKQEKNIQ